MENTGVVNPIKLCVVNGIFFGFHNCGTLCHNIVTGIRISKTKSKDDIISIGPARSKRGNLGPCPRPWRGVVTDPPPHSY